MEPVLSRRDEAAAIHLPHTRNDVVNSKLAIKAFIVLSIVVVGIAIAYQYVCITAEEAAMHMADHELNTKPKNIVEEMQTENKGENNNV